MIKYIALGIIQGLTEFLPVSSSGHLVILQGIFGISENRLGISVVLHSGTVLALLVFFFRDILNLLRDIKLLLLVALVTLITGIIGLAGKDFFAGLFNSPRLAALALVVTGAILILARRFKAAKRDDLNIKDALILGLAQGAAIIPGISRSGITISTLLLRGISLERSFTFSFLAAIPAVLGASLLEAGEINFAFQAGLKNIIMGFIFSFAAGILSLWFLKRALAKAKLHYFGYYCIFAAIITLLFVK